MWSELSTNKSAVTSFSLVSCVREKKLLGSTECSQFKPRGDKSSESNLGLGKKGGLGTVFPRVTLALDLK